MTQRVDHAAPLPVPALAAVTRASESFAHRRGMVPLDRNERLAPLPDSFVEKLREAVASSLLTSYPSLDELYEDLAAYTALPRESLLLTPGSDGAFRSLYQAYVAPGARAVMLDPSYAMYAVYADIFGADAVKIPVARDLSIDVDALLEAIGGGTRLVLLANPTQPTGTSFSEGGLRRIVERAAEEGAVVLVDEAYYPFSGSTVVDWVREWPNLVVTRTFSKAAGLAGLRVGFAAAAPEVITALAKVRSVFDITSFAAAAVRTVLAHPEVMSDYVAQVDEGRALLAERTRALGLEPIESATNFMVIRVAQRAQPTDLAAALRDRGWIVRAPFTADCLADCIRVTLGPPELMGEFCDVLESVLAES